MWKRLFPLSQTQSCRRTSICTFHYNTSLNKMIQLYLKNILKGINSFTRQYKKILTQKSNELLMSLYAGIHVNDGSIPVAMCISIKLWSPKKRTQKTPLQTTSRTFIQNNRVHKTTVRVNTCCRNFGFIIWTTTSFKIKYKD